MEMCSSDAAALMYVILPVPLILFAGADTSVLFAESENSWVDATKFC
ncbi:hypothetical protein LXL04_038040 [Taraxacum kok-saghyz]